MGNRLRTAKVQLLVWLAAILTAFALILVPATDDNAFATGLGSSEACVWRQDSNGWWYQRADGTWPASCWEQIDGEWYLFDSYGYMKTGWVSSGGYWRYLGSDGAMKTGWLWDGAWYYLDPANDGIMITGWLNLDGCWRYMASSGIMQTGWLFYGGSWYYLDPTNDGIMATGWLWDGAWYYLDPARDGAMATGLVSDGSAIYYMASSGIMQTGWVSMADGWRYFAASGALQTGWLQDGARYYLNPEFGGRMATGLVNIEGESYYFGNDGAMRTGWAKMDDGWRCFGDDGAMQTGWLSFGGARYYLDPANNGLMATGWLDVDGYRYYFYDSGKMAHDSWIDDCYLLSDGRMATNQWIDDRYVGADGKWVSGAVVTSEQLIAAMNAGESVIVMGDITLNEPVVVAEEVDIDLNGYTLYSQGLDLTKGGKIANGGIKSSADTQVVYHLKVSGGTLTMDHVDVCMDHMVATDVLPDGFYYTWIGFRIQNATAVLNDCSIRTGDSTYDFRDNMIHTLLYAVQMENGSLEMNGGSLSSHMQWSMREAAIDSGDNNVVTLRDVSIDSTYCASVGGSLILNSTAESPSVYIFNGASYEFNHID